MTEEPKATVSTAKTRKRRKLKVSPKLQTGQAYEMIFKLGEIAGILSQQEVYDELKNYIDESLLEQFGMVLHKIRGGLYKND